MNCISFFITACICSVLQTQIPSEQPARFFSHDAAIKTMSANPSVFDNTVQSINNFRMFYEHPLQWIRNLPPVSFDSSQTQQDFTIVMVGDVLLHDRIEASCLGEDGQYHYESLFRNVRNEISQADLALVNQEVIIGGESLGVEGYPCFNAPFALADTLADTGFDVILHGTNHALDRGKQGLLNCLENWNTTYPDISILGIHNSKQSYDQVPIIEKNSYRIAVLNYTYGTNGITLPSDLPYGVSYLEQSKVISDLIYAKEHADFTIVCPHWGTEYSLKSTNEQKNWVKLFAEYGADLVIGTHPHVLEPVVLYEFDDRNDLLVYYSLGNFVNWTSHTGADTLPRMLGGMAKIKLTKDADGTIRFKDCSLSPLVSHVSNSYEGVTVYPLEQYTEELALQNQIIDQDPTFSVDRLQNLFSAFETVQSSHWSD